MGQEERYKDRQRFIYALIFKDKHCYVGQTVDLERRKQEHKGSSGGWKEPFEMIQLDIMQGTRQEAEDFEYAWRYTAQRKGWRIIGKPPKLLVDSTRHMTVHRHRIAKGKKWPLHKSDSIIWTSLKMIAGFVIVTALLYSLNFVF